MSDFEAAAYARTGVEELRTVMGSFTPESLEALTELLTKAPRVFFTGTGRSGLMAKAIAMRLMHIGVPSCAVGESATPGIREGDLLVVFTSSGRGTMLEQARTARRHGARVAVITTRGDGELNELAAAIVVLPIRETIPTEQHAGSLFEQSALVIGDAVLRAVQERLGVPSSALDERHANLS